MHKYTNDKRKIRDQCHYSGKYRDATYSISNLKYGMPKGVVVVSSQYVKQLLSFCYKRTRKRV